MKRIISVLSVIIMLFSGCSQRSFKDEKDLLLYLKDPKNGYAQNRIINGIEFSLFYRPTDLLVIQELKNRKNTTNISHLRNKYRDYLYFNLNISKGNKEVLSSIYSNQNKFGAMVNKLAFGIGKKVHLYTRAKDTISMSDFIYPREYGLGHSTKIMFAYPRKELQLKEGVLNFVIEEIGLNTGDVGFKIPLEVLMNEPTIEF